MQYPIKDKSKRQAFPAVGMGYHTQDLKVERRGRRLSKFSRSMDRIDKQIRMESKRH